jgi:hypothetical protein
LGEGATAVRPELAETVPHPVQGRERRATGQRRLPEAARLLFGGEAKGVRVIFGGPKMTLTPFATPFAPFAARRLAAGAAA